MEPGLSDQDDSKKWRVFWYGDDLPQWSLVFPTRMTTKAQPIRNVKLAAMEPGLSDQDDSVPTAQVDGWQCAAMEPGLSDQDDTVVSYEIHDYLDWPQWSLVFPTRMTPSCRCSLTPT